MGASCFQTSKLSRETVVEDELFWGLDQFRYLALYLDGKDPLASVETVGPGSLGRAVVRPGSVGRGQGNSGEVLPKPPMR